MATKLIINTIITEEVATKLIKKGDQRRCHNDKLSASFHSAATLWDTFFHQPARQQDTEQQQVLEYRDTKMDTRSSTTNDVSLFLVPNAAIGPVREPSRKHLC